MRPLIFVWIIFLSLVNRATFAQTYQQLLYQSDSSNFANPERGFYHHTETHSTGYSLLDKATLQSYRSEGISLILRVFYLEKFVTQEISDQYLLYIQQDFNTARASGVKVVVRFAYTTRSTAPYGDAAPEWVLKHIAQLSPLLKENADIISVVQAGFIGAWGEWYYTDYYSHPVGAPKESDWVNRRALINALANAVPASRMIQVRTPAIKYKLTNSQTPLTDQDAFTGTVGARLAFHNDCFLASADDYGTYTSNMDQEKNFLQQETIYQPMGGETCGIDVPLSECPNAVAQLQRFHWSFINRDYNGSVLDTWQTDNCLSVVYTKLGYRFRITKAKLQQASKPSGSITLAMSMINDGWANPYNTRNVEIVMKNSVTKKEYVFKTSEDPRKWPLSDTIKIQVTAGLPKAMEEGTYAVYLNLPDPTSALHKNPAYSIRMANTDMWDSQTGYNNLNHIISVSKSAVTPTYTGDSFFSSLASVPPFIKQMKTDGVADEWKIISPLIISNQAGIKSFKVYNNSDSIYFLISGSSLQQSFQLFMDADESATTGFNVSAWQDNGADYKIENATFYKYSGGIWNAVTNVTLSRNDSLIEIGIPFNLFTGIPVGYSLDVAVVHDPAAVVKSSYLPALNSLFVPYRVLLGQPLKPGVTSCGNKAIVYWESEQSSTNNTVLEKSVSGGDYSQIVVLPPGTIYYIDSDLSTSTSYSYRIHYQRADQMSVSSYSDVVGIATIAKPDYYTFDSDGNPNEWANVIPLATSNDMNALLAYRIFVSSNKLNVLWEGAALKQYTIYLDTDTSETTGLSAAEGNYHGYDYKLSNDSLYSSATGSWKFSSIQQSAVTPGFNEVSVPVKQMSLLGTNTMIKTVAVVKTVEDKIIHLPELNALPLNVARVLPEVPPSIMVNNSESLPESQLIIQWSSCASCGGFVIERSVGDTVHFAFLAKRNQMTHVYFDNNLTISVPVYYRVFAFNEAGPSLYSEIKSNAPHITTGVEKDITHTLFFPNPVERFLQVYTESGKAHVEFMDLQGKVMTLAPAETFKNSIQFDLFAFARGFYVVKVSEHGVVYYGKLLKE